MRSRYTAVSPSRFEAFDRVEHERSESGADLAELDELIDESKVRAPVHAELPLDQVAAAIDLLASGDVKGKLAIAVS